MDEKKDNGVSIKIPTELAGILRQVASKEQMETKRFCSVASLIKRAVVEFLDKNPLK